MEGLVVGEAVQVLIVLLFDFLIVLRVRLRLEIVEKSEKHLQCDEGVGAGLMLGAHAHD